MSQAAMIAVGVLIMVSAHRSSFANAFAPPSSSSTKVPFIELGQHKTRPNLLSSNIHLLPCKQHHISPTSSLSAAYLDSLEVKTAEKNVKDSRDLGLDKWLERLTTAFPVFVLSSALIGYVQPSTLMWVNRGNIVTLMLAAVMWGTGLTLRKRDFVQVLEKPSNRIAVPLGVFCQFAIMPLTAYLVGKTLLLPSAGAATSKVQEALFLGLCLVGSAPGGTASNLVSLIAGANVALSVILTTCSTLAAVFMTPLLVKLLVGSQISVSGLALCAATAKVVLLPVLGGMLFKAKAPRTARTVSRFTPFASVLLVSLICGGVVAQTTPLLMETTTVSATAAAASSGLGSLLNLGSLSDMGATSIPRIAALSGLAYWTSMHPAIAPVILGGLLISKAGGGGALLSTSSAVSFPLVLSSVLLLHSIGFAVGYMVPKSLAPKKERNARTISIEVGMQNSALAVVLARSIAGAHPAASLPGALSATVHSCLGSLLAAYWRMRRAKPGED